MQGGEFATTTSVAGSTNTFVLSGTTFSPTLPANSASLAGDEFDAIWLLKGGYRFTDRFAVEARYALTDDSHRSAPLAVVTDTTIYRYTTTTTANSELSEWCGVYGKLGFRGAARFRPYLLGGYASREITSTYSSSRAVTHATSRGVSNVVSSPSTATIASTSTDTAAGLSVGAGFNIGFGKRVDFNVEWLNNDAGGLIFSGPAYSALNAGLAFKF